MEIKELNISGVYEVTLDKISDKRGYFVRTFDINKFNDFNISINWVQENSSYSIKKHTIRGLHMQLPPFDETKLVRCTQGKILDVFVDLRINSDSFGKSGSVTLNGNNMVLIPKGFAHGFCTLEDNCSVFYKVDNFYNPSKEYGIMWNDKDLNLNWPTKKPIISDKDNTNSTLQDYIRVLNKEI